jgi:hypothetical protein
LGKEVNRLPYYPNYFPLHNERELEAIKNGTWIQGDVTMILQKDRKLKKIKELGEYGRGNMQITNSNIE